MLGILVISDMGAVHHLDDFTIDVAGFDAQLFPDFLSLLGGSFQIQKLALRLTELSDRSESDFSGEFIDRFSINCDVDGLPTDLTRPEPR